MKKLSILSLPMLLLLPLSSCWRTIQCIDVSQQLEFIGFDSTELNSVILYKYQTGNTFSQLVDSFDIGTNSYVWDHYRGSFYPDSLITTGMIHKPYDTTLTINNFYDWKIYVPATGKSYLISDIRYDQQTKKMEVGWDHPDLTCFNNTSYYLNNTLFVLNKDSVKNRFDYFDPSYRDYISIKIYK